MVDRLGVMQEGGGHLSGSGEAVRPKRRSAKKT